MNFIFMLTRQDRTVADCLDVLAQIAPLGLKHIGFKDIGVDPQTLARSMPGSKPSAPRAIWKSSPPRRKPR